MFFRAPVTCELSVRAERQFSLTNFMVVHRLRPANANVPRILPGPRIATRSMTRHEHRGTICAHRLTPNRSFRTLRAMWLGEEEQIILRYLAHVGEVGASLREICRKSWTKDIWKENERWAYPFLQSLRDKKLIETTPAGNYRLPPPEEEDEKKKH
jgi:hypothetical protein